MNIRQSPEAHFLFPKQTESWPISDGGVKWHLSSIHHLTLFQLDFDAKVPPCAQGLSFSLSPAPPQHLPSCCYRLPVQHVHRDVTTVDLYSPPAKTSNAEQVGKMTKHFMWTEKKPHLTMTLAPALHILVMVEWIGLTR